MKKIVSILMVAVMLSTTVFASAKTPDFLAEIYTNYTMDSVTTMTLDNGDAIMALLEEAEITEEVGNFADVKTLLQSLFASSGKMNMQLDINDSFDKIQMAVTSEGDQKIDINSNLNIGLFAKVGMWINADISDAENPVVDIICEHPFFNKYLVINAGDLLKEAPEAIDMIKLVFNKTNMDYINKVLTEMYAEHATIKSRGNQYTVTIDNEGFTAFVDDILKYVLTFVPQLEEIAVMEEIPSLKGWKILGEKGMETVYTLRGGKIDTEETTVDFSIDICQIHKLITGEEWPYNSADTIDFTLKTSSKVTNIGRTKVVFPEITEENSITLEDLMPDYDYYEEDVTYPNEYLHLYCDNIPVINGDIYLPLRATIEDAYGDSAVIDYKDGVITVTSEYFPGFGTLKMTVDDNKIYTDGVAHSLGKVFTINDVTYVNSRLFTEVFGWELGSATYDIIEDTYYYWLFTR